MTPSGEDKDTREWNLCKLSNSDAWLICGDVRATPEGLVTAKGIIVVEHVPVVPKSRLKRAESAEARLHNVLLEINSDWSDWDEIAALKRVLQIAEDALKGRPDYYLDIPDDQIEEPTDYTPIGADLQARLLQAEQEADQREKMLRKAWKENVEQIRVEYRDAMNERVEQAESSNEKLRTELAKAQGIIKECEHMFSGIYDKVREFDPVWSSHLGPGPAIDALLSSNEELRGETARFRAALREIVESRKVGEQPSHEQLIARAALSSTGG